MANSKINLERLLNSESYIEKPNLFTINDLKSMAANPSERRRSIDKRWNQEDWEEFSEYEYSPDSTMLIQFALEDHSIKLQDISQKLNIEIDILKELVKGTRMPWKLKAQEILNFIYLLDISSEDFIKSLFNKKITIRLKDIRVSGIHLPRAKNLSKKDQKEAMLEMEHQIAIQDEEEARDTFIQELKNLVKR